VLRDLGASEFQARNTAADLALVFTDMRRMNVNLFGVMMLSPQLTSAPEVDSEGRLRLSGYVPIQPVQIKFDLVFESTSGIWKLLNIGISTPQAEQANAQGGQPRPQSGEPKLPAANAKASTKQAPAPKTKPTPPPASGAPPTQSAKEE
jgi:hypothetical protein